MTHETTLPDGWLRRELERAEREVASWPAGKREAMMKAAEPRPPDPCRCKRACDEAQTCVGGCVYGR